MSPPKKDSNKSTQEPKSQKKTYSSAGQPTKYKPEYCDQVIEYGRQGKFLVEFACDIDVTTETVREWGQKHEEFSLAKKRAHEACEKFFIEAGRPGIVNPKNFNTGLWIFFMKAKFGWQEDHMPETDNITIEFV